MKMLCSILAIFLSLGNCWSDDASAKEKEMLDSRYKQLPDFQLPNFDSDPEFLPLVYLNRMRVEDVKKKLSKKEKLEISKLFIETSKAVKRKHHQDYELETNVQIYQLLKTNFPELIKLERERQHIIFLGDIAKYLSSLPENETLHKNEQAK